MGGDRMTCMRWQPGTRPDFVLFDLDGTLSDSAPGITNAMASALKAHGHPVPDPATLRSFVGPPFRVALEGIGLADEADSIVATYRETYNAGGLFDNALYPGIPRMLTDLAQAGVVMVVATSKPQATARRIIEHFDLTDLFEGGLRGVHGADISRPGDSKADVIGRALDACAERGVGTDTRVVMVGDRVHDVEGAAAHDIPCLGAGWGYAADDELVSAGALAVAETPQALEAILIGT